MIKTTGILETPIGKMVLEALRWAVLAFASTLITKLLELVPNAEIDSNLTVYLTIFLRFIDAALHKSGVAEKGITRF
jgi:hypothetical protein